MEHIQEAAEPIIEEIRPIVRIQRTLRYQTPSEMDLPQMNENQSRNDRIAEQMINKELSFNNLNMSQNSQNNNSNSDQAAAKEENKQGDQMQQILHHQNVFKNQLNHLGMSVNNLKNHLRSNSVGGIGALNHKQII